MDGRNLPIVFHPAKTLSETLFNSELNLYDFAKDSGIPMGILYNILDEKQDITEDIADKLEKSLKIPAHFWLNMQQNYNNFMTWDRKISVDVELGGERLYIIPFVPEYVDKQYPKLKKISKELGFEFKVRNTAWNGAKTRIKLLYDDRYSIPYQLKIRHEWVDNIYLKPTKAFIYNVLVRIARGEEYQDSDSHFRTHKYTEANAMLKWISENGGLDSIEFIYSLDT